MKGKLIKRDNNFYSLIVDGLVMATSNGMIVDYKLSLKNCQAIANGYDLDELSHKEYLLHENNDELYGNSLELRLAYKAGVYDGLKRMLTVLGDKKFSEEDVHHALHLMNNQVRLAYIDNALEMVKKSTEQRDNIIQSLQQTEWDVDIVEDTSMLWQFPEPKLDQNGCLILKRSV